MGKLKIFLAYHKKTPVYKSDVFEPVQAGAELSDIDLGFLKDNQYDNISDLNSYYCELTMQYYILKNYLTCCEEEYIGFSHYRRLLDLTKLSPQASVYGLKYTASLKVFQSFADFDLAKMCAPYDIILPCKVYMYKDTVNPMLREDETPLNMYEQFFIEHHNNLADILREVIAEYYPEFLPALEKCYGETTGYFYNIYVMKKEILKEFLLWKFKVLELTGEKAGGWRRACYLRMAGFLGERLINIWLEKNKDKDYRIGLTPVYMIDFESEYIERANTFDHIGRYDLEIKELEKLYEYASCKFKVSSAILNCLSKDKKDIRGYFNTCYNDCKTAEDYNKLAKLLADNNKEAFKSEIINCYKKATDMEPKNKLFAVNLLKFCSEFHDMELLYPVWQNMLNYDLDDKEREKYDRFMKCYKLVHK